MTFFSLLGRAVFKPILLITVVSAAYAAARFFYLPSAYATQVGEGYFVLMALLIALLVSRALTTGINQWFRVQKKLEKTPRLFSKIVSLVVYLAALAAILGHFNVEVTPIIATLGVGGLAVGLALQSTLANFFAGLHILSDKPVRVGDYVEFDKSVSGFIEDIGGRSTRVRTIHNNTIVVPNSKLAESIVTNYSMPDNETTVEVECGVGYGSDLKKVEKVTLEAARKIQKAAIGAVRDFHPFVRFHTFGDSNVNFRVYLRLESIVDRHLVVHEFIKALKEAYDAEGIEISYPARKVYNAK